MATKKKAPETEEPKVQKDLLELIAEGKATTEDLICALVKQVAINNRILADLDYKVSSLLRPRVDLSDVKSRPFGT